MKFFGLRGEIRERRREQEAARVHRLAKRLGGYAELRELMNEIAVRGLAQDEWAVEQLNGKIVLKPLFTDAELAERKRRFAKHNRLCDQREADFKKAYGFRRCW